MNKKNIDNDDTAEKGPIRRCSAEVASAGRDGRAARRRRGPRRARRARGRGGAGALPQGAARLGGALRGAAGGARVPRGLASLRVRGRVERRRRRARGDEDRS